VHGPRIYSTVVGPKDPTLERFPDIKIKQKKDPPTKHTEKVEEKGTILLLKILKLEATPLLKQYFKYESLSPLPFRNNRYHP
jgi:hypothetical protein